MCVNNKRLRYLFYTSTEKLIFLLDNYKIADNLYCASFQFHEYTLNSLFLCLECVHTMPTKLRQSSRVFTRSR